MTIFNVSYGIFGCVSFILATHPECGDSVLLVGRILFGGWVIAISVSVLSNDSETK